MTEQAIVKQINGKLVTLGCNTGACSTCAGSSMCNIKEREILAINKEKIPLQIGDTATIYLHPGKTIFSAFLVMILPLVMFIVAFQAGEKLLGLEAEGQKVLLGMAGILVGFGISWLYGKTAGKNQYPEIIRDPLPETDENNPDNIKIV